MTRGEIKSFANALLQESEGAPGVDPMLLDLFVDQAVNEICRATGCYYLSYSMDLVEGQQQYSAPPLYEIRAVYATLSNGNNASLVAYTARQLDDLCPLWRWDPATNLPTGGDPICYIPNGLNTVWLYPVPDYSLGGGATATATESSGHIPSNGITLSAGGSGYLNPPAVVISDPAGTGATATATIIGGVVNGISVTNGGSGYTSPTVTLHTYGLTFEGFSVPKDGDQSLWPNDSDTCPIPTRGHEAAAYRVAILRCLQNPTPENQMRRPALDREYAVLKGYLESEAAKFTAATRYRAHVGNQMHVPYYPY